MLTWLALVLAGLFEIGWALGLKYSDGFTRLWPSIATVLAIGSSFGLLGLASLTRSNISIVLELRLT